MLKPEAILEEMFNSYLIKGELSGLEFHIRLLDIDKQWKISHDRVQEVPLNTTGFEAIVTLSQSTLEKLYSGTLSPITACARANINDKAPLDFILPEGKKLDANLYQAMILFVQRFFNPRLPELLLFGDQFSRQVHGGNVCGLFYSPGFRSAWYQISPNQQLNNPGDTNPFPQAFIFIKGSGKVKIGEITQDINAGQSVYIPPGTEHICWSSDDEPLELIFLAWGEKA
ncbi:MAG TPA: cupin domain-containing protein [Anaerolineaceae bacterium]|nr:cupin domain-containing protein [Anaerolineaceae bacterium]